MNEELQFQRSRNGFRCGGSDTSYVTKRARLDPSTPLRPLSLISEEDDQLENESPFGAKLRM